MLRFGGVTVDTQAALSDADTPMPAWASTEIDRDDLVDLGRLARASGWRVLLTVGLAHFEPTRAARKVLAARDLLGGLLAGVELGNEPDAYGRRHRLRPQPWTLARYDANVSSYRRVGPTDSSLPFSRVAHNTILRVQWTVQDVRAQQRLGVLGEQWTHAFHTLYLKRQFRVTGKIRYHGQLLWKLERRQKHAPAPAKTTPATTCSSTPTASSRSTPA